MQPSQECRAGAGREMEDNSHSRKLGTSSTVTEAAKDLGVQNS